MVSVSRCAQVILTQSFALPVGYLLSGTLDKALKAGLADMLMHLLAVDFEAFAELDVGPADDLLEQGLALDQRQLPKVVTIQVKQIEGNHDDLARSAFQLVLKNGKVRRAVGRRRDYLTVDDRRPGTDMPCIGSDLLEALVRLWPRRVNTFTVSLARWT